MITLRELKATLNRVPEDSLDLPLIVADTFLADFPPAPYVYINPANADDGVEGQLVVMGTMSCGPLRLEPQE